jgi:hypothetical protein
MDYYELLGVSRSASDAEIKRAYRKLSFAYHPDRNADPQTVELYKEINASYDVLSDPEKRHTYDLRFTYQFDIQPESPRARHRDTRYRPSNPNAPRPRSNAQIQIDFMRQLMKYLRWVNRVGFVVAALFFVDYILPYRELSETVKSVDVYRGSGRGSSVRYVIIHTNEGTRIKNYNLAEFLVEPDDPIAIRKTWIYANVVGMKLDGHDWEPIMYLYKTLSIFPWGLLLGSVIGLVFEKRSESFAFNGSIFAAIFLVITLFLIL